MPSDLEYSWDDDLKHCTIVAHNEAGIRWANYFLRTQVSGWQTVSPTEHRNKVNVDFLS